VVWSQLAGLVLLLLALPFLPAATVSSRDWIWGFSAGFSGGIGVAFLLSRACCRHDGCRRADPAVIAAMIPILFAFRNRRTIATTHVCRRRARAPRDLAREPSPAGAKGGHRFNAPRFSTGLRPRASFRDFRWHFLLSLARTSVAAGMWPLIAARISSITLFVLIAFTAKRTLMMNRTAAATATLGGALDMAANAVYMTAARIGPLSIVVTLASLYPASTVSPRALDFARTPEPRPNRRNHLCPARRCPDRQSGSAL